MKAPPDRCSKRRMGDGKQCIRPEGHPGTCAVSWLSRTTNWGHDETAPLPVHLEPDSTHLDGTPRGMADGPE